MTRKCKNWISSLLEYVEETESPRNFWFWAGLSTLASALQRKAWLPFGLSTLYPNLYVMIIAPPGVCRKGAPVGFSKQILDDIKIQTFVDSPTKRALTKALDEQGRMAAYKYDGKLVPHCSMSLVSKELSSFFAVDSKGMIEVLTDLFDSHDVWEYKTSDKGFDKLHKVCINCIFASTPSWIAANLPEEAIGGGFTSRFIIVNGTEKYKWISLPPPGNKELYKDLKDDLAHISRLVGEFRWEEGAKQAYDSWYMTIPLITKSTRDYQLHAYLSRMHIMMLKVAMLLQVAVSDELIMTVENIQHASKLVESILKDTSVALGGQGSSKLSDVTNRVLTQLRTYKEIEYAEIIKLNYKQATKTELDEVIDTIHAMGNIEQITKGTKNIKWLIWKGGSSTNQGGKKR